jgi:hypothetical protein
VDKDRYESERIAALKKRRREESRGSAPDKRSLEERFGPGSFGCHEAMHVTNLVVELIEQQLATHSAVLLDPYWFHNVREAQSLLYSAYNAIGGDHLSAPMPDGDRPQPALATKK